MRAAVNGTTVEIAAEDSGDRRRLARARAAALSALFDDDGETTFGVVLSDGDGATITIVPVTEPHGSGRAADAEAAVLRQRRVGPGRRLALRG